MLRALLLLEFPIGMEGARFGTLREKLGEDGFVANHRKRLSCACAVRFPGPALPACLTRVPYLAATHDQ